jgi:integral membrane protein (TIGR01906 family)
MKKGVSLFAIPYLVLFVCTPLLLLLSNLYILVTPTFVHYEYGKADFPPAALYSAEDRLRLAEDTVHYLRSGEGVDYLRHLRAGETAVYNDREIKHLIDVKAVMQVAFLIHALCAVLCGLALLAAWRRPSERSHALKAMCGGCVTFLALLALIGAVAYTSFDVFFVAFHRIFFEGTSWLFLYSDTLIQLFPVQFWMDATCALTLLTVGECIMVGAAACALSRRLRVAHDHS